MNRTRMIQILRPLALPLLMILAAGVLAFVYREEVGQFVAFARDREAVNAYLDRIGIIGPLALMGLVGVQVLIPYLPSEPPIIAGGYAYGFASGLLMSWLVMVAVTQLVFWLARWLGSPLVDLFVPEKALEKWTNAAATKGTIFFLLAFIIPPVPSDIMVYVAGISRIKAGQFFIANLIGRLPLVALYALVGANGFAIDGRFLLWLSVIGVILMLAWWYYLVRERSDQLVTVR